MIKRLQTKFILVTISILLVVFSSVLLVINLINYNNLKKNAEDKIEMVLNIDRSGMPSEIPFSARYFKVIYQDNHISYDLNHIITVNEKEALIMSSSINKDEGFYDDFYYKVIYQDNTNNKIIFFLDTHMERENFLSFMRTSILITFGGLLIISSLVIIFSKLVTKPILDGYQERKEFISNINHEIKTPLAIIKGTNEIIELEYKKSEWTKIIDEQTNKMDELLKKSLFISKMDEDKLALNKVEFNYSEVIKEVVSPFGVLAIKDNKKIIINVEEEIKITGEESLLGELVSILVDNAIKYSTTNSNINVLVKKHNKNIILKVSNKVNDIKVGDHNYLFERYYRNEELSNNKHGYGIGLSMAKTIVKLHNGKIKCYSKDGKSMTFEVIF